MNETSQSGLDDRCYWVSVLTRIAEPVLSALAEGRLRTTMPVEAAPGAHEGRRKVTHLEAVGRTLAGIAPWLALPDNGCADSDEAGRKRALADLAGRGLTLAVDPASPDFLNFSDGQQPLVDAAFLAHGLLRAPGVLWEPLDAVTKHNFIAALETTRTRKPGFSNWLLFAATVEAALCRLGRPWDRMRVDYAVRQHEQWYKGDGVYGDGPHFHWDYYNSFVIQPMLLDVLEAVSPTCSDWDAFLPAVRERAQRYAAVLERLISPEGTFPAVGRSLAYRFGAFQLLGQMALRRELPPEIRPSQVRCALTSVIRRLIEAPGTFDANGWLTIGFCGHQPSLGERYISTGSLYLCLVGLLPLGLPASDPFWSDEPAPWTAQRIWSGENVPADHALK